MQNSKQTTAVIYGEFDTGKSTLLAELKYGAEYEFEGIEDIVDIQPNENSQEYINVKDQNHSILVSQLESYGDPSSNLKPIGGFYDAMSKFNGNHQRQVIILCLLGSGGDPNDTP